MYESAKVYKEHTKACHDKRIMRKHFEPNQNVLLYDSPLHLFPSKLQSRWTGPFVVKNVYPHSAIDVEDPTNGNTFNKWPTT